MATFVHPPPPSPSPEAIKPEKINYMNLPCPIPYEEINREALMSLKAEHFEGMRVDITKVLNQRFSLSHSIVMGPPTEIPSLFAKPTKIPTAHYGFGANFIDPKLTLLGRITTDGLVNSAVKCDLSENLSTKVYGQLTSEPNMSRGVVNFDYKGTDYRTQFQFGNGGLLGASYIQSVTPRLSIGGNVLWAGQHRESGIGYAARYNTDKMVASGQILLAMERWLLAMFRKYLKKFLWRLILSTITCQEMLLPASVMIIYFASVGLEGRLIQMVVHLLFLKKGWI